MWFMNTEVSVVLEGLFQTPISTMWNYDINYAELIVWSTVIYKKKTYSICTFYQFCLSLTS